MQEIKETGGREANYKKVRQTISRIHERTISLRFLDIHNLVLRLEVSIYNVYITNQFQSTKLQKFKEGRGKIC